MPSGKIIEFVRILCLKVSKYSLCVLKCRISKKNAGSPRFRVLNRFLGLVGETWRAGLPGKPGSFRQGKHKAPSPKGDLQWNVLVVVCQHYAVQTIQKPAASYRIYSSHSMVESSASPWSLRKKKKRKRQPQRIRDKGCRRCPCGIEFRIWDMILTSKWNQTWEREPGYSPVVLSHSSGHGNAIRRSYQKMWGWLPLVALCTCPRQNFLRATTVDSREVLALVWVYTNSIWFTCFHMHSASSLLNLLEEILIQPRVISVL